MKLYLFSCLDTKVGAFLPPFYGRSDGEAVRAFETSIAIVDSPLGRHPRDYVLYRLGWFEDDSGRLTPESHPVLVESGDSVVNRMTHSGLFADLELGDGYATEEELRDGAQKEREQLNG